MSDACSRVAAMTLALATISSWARAQLTEEQQQFRQLHMEQFRQEQLKREAPRMERAFRQALHAELELIRATCGSLSFEGRRNVSAIGNEAVKALVRQFAERKITGKGFQDFDPPKTIRDAMAAAVKQHAASEEFAAYERELASRIARRSRAPRMLLMHTIEREFVLSQSQRERIADDLEEHWDETWSRKYPVSQTITGHNRFLAPDYADRCIAPHLDDRQREHWKNWCEQAGWNRMAQPMGWSMVGGNSTMQPDPWWTP